MLLDIVCIRAAILAAVSKRSFNEVRGPSADRTGAALPSHLLRPSHHFSSPASPKLNPWQAPKIPPARR